MRRLVCRLVTREGPAPFPCVVVDPDGWRLRLTHAPSRPGLPPVGRVAGELVWAEQLADAADAPGEGAAEIVIEEEETFDEVGVRAGADEDVAGLFDLPGRDRTGTGERTGHHSEEAELDQQRTAVLAWVAATLGPNPADVPDTAACGPLKRKIADEPLDPVPPLDGVIPSTLVAPRLPPAVLRARPLGENTVTRTESLPEALTSTTVAPVVLLRWPMFAAAAFVFAASVAWWWAR